MLTKSQKKVYDYLKSRVQEGLPPTVREICQATGLKSTSSVHAHLKTLEREGYISREAGQPILAVEHVEGYVPFSPPSDGYEYFALNVRGESMRMIGIMNGDIVIAQQTNIARDGDIVVAMIEDEATVKTFYKEKDRIRLQPENPDYQPIYAQNGEVAILGKVVAVMRYY